MRIFEVALILGNLLALLMGARKQSKQAWAAITGSNLLVLLLHGIFEGLRYQMAFCYIFTVLLILFALVNTLRKPGTINVPRGLRILAMGLSVVLLGVTSALAYAFPVFTLPEPTGDYAVGIRYFHLIDQNRADPFLDPSTKQRELMIKVYYPAQPDDSKPFARYFHDSPELIRLFTEFYNLPAFTFDHLLLVKTNSKEDLSVSDRQPNYPVILVSHGAGTSMEVQTAQSEDLASHGYIVVTIDHTYVSAATAFPDRLVSHKEATRNFDAAEPAEIITQIMVEDAAFVIDQLAAMNAGRMDSMFTGKLNLEKIGAMGHSVGGATAYNLAIHDSRVKAAVNLDGAVYVAPEGDLKTVAPVLMLANDQYHVQAIQSHKPLMKSFAEMDELDQKITVEMYGSQEAYEQAYQKALQNVLGLISTLKQTDALFTIEGSDHMKFIDVGLFLGVQPLREMIGIRGNTDPTRCLEITSALTLAFFDQHLKNETSVSFEVLVEKYPELERVNLK